MPKEVRNLLFAEYRPSVAKLLYAGLELLQTRSRIGMMKDFQANPMNSIFREVDFWRIRRHQMELYMNREFRHCCCTKGLHFLFVRCVSVQKNLQ